MEELLSYVLPWAERNREPVENITFRCFLYIEQNAGVLSRYNELIAEQHARGKNRQYVNSHIAQKIAQHLNLTNTEDEVQLPKGHFLINSYSILN